MNEAWLDRLLECVERDGRSMRAISIAAGNGPNWLQQVFKNKKDPGFNRLAKTLDILGTSATLYVISGTQMGDEDAELFQILLSVPPRVRAEALDLFRAIQSREDLPLLQPSARE
ncbi:hypothetical protein [Roseicitreum antarcticum]|uniref:Uncharacterized protein n=1 Tax=Roseicitreum antarcticum TaxID=564137 RepID=A0A1H3G857_9RHOB|nr:hypothetical protein [Roseicitreum antarcticum]SDX99225.1 hypothetical protein SAMN04488238_1701 [Roseicitreum antarcticum]